MTSRSWKIAHWFYLALLACLMPICVFLNMFPCSPVASNYTLRSIASLPDPRVVKCLNLKAVSLTTRTLHIVTDWLLVPVPLIIIYRLQMPLKKKLRLGFVFSVGIISSVAAIVRNVLINRVTTDLTCKSILSHTIACSSTLTSALDDYYAIYAWDVVDISFATIVASLPALNDLGETLGNKWKSLDAQAGSWSKIYIFGSSKGQDSAGSKGMSMTSRRPNGLSSKSEIVRQTDIELSASSAQRSNSHLTGDEDVAMDNFGVPPVHGQSWLHSSQVNSFATRQLG